MAPRTRAQRQPASTTRRSVDTTADGAPSPPNRHSPDDDRQPSRFISKPDQVEDTQEELKMPQQSYARVLLEMEMLVPQTYDPDTYDPDAPVPWTPEPEPYDPETYAAWGRKHFGEEWYKLRETMLRERNIYRVSDPVYLERQKALRVMEHKIEGRPFRPAVRAGEMSDKDWKRLWSRLSKVLPRVQPPTPASSVADDSDGDTNLSGFSTYDPTPSPREPSPVPVFNDAWERLEYERKRSCWSEEEYQFERIFRKEERIDWARAKHEDQEGDRQREKELEEIEKVRYEPGTAFKSAEYERRMRHFNLRADGWTQEQIDADDRAAAAAAQKREIESEERLNTPPKNQEEMNSKFRRWDLSGISREEQDWLGRMHGFYERPPNPYIFHASKEKRTPPRNQEEMDQLFRLWKSKLSRVEQNELARMYGFGPRQLDMPPRSQEEMNLKFDLWDLSGISREEQDWLGRMHGFSERPPPDPNFFGTPMEKRLPPRNQEEMDLLFRLWNWKLSRVEQNELARMYGFGPRQAGTDGHADGEVAPQAQASPLRPAKDTPARGSRVTKNAPQSRSHRAARSRRSAPTSTEAPPPDRRRHPSKPDASEELSDKTQVIPQAHRRQRRTYQKERASRRLAGQLPEFGLLSGRGETPSFYEAPLQLSNTRKTSSPGARNGGPSKKPTAKGAKPQGVSKYGQGGAGRWKRPVRGVSG